MNGWSRDLRKKGGYKIFFKKSVWKDFESIPNIDFTYKVSESFQ